MMAFMIQQRRRLRRRRQALLARDCIYSSEKDTAVANEWTEYK